MLFRSVCLFDKLLKTSESFFCIYYGIQISYEKPLRRSSHLINDSKNDEVTNCYVVCFVSNQFFRLNLLD